MGIRLTFYLSLVLVAVSTVSVARSCDPALRAISQVRYELAKRVDEFLDLRAGTDSYLAMPIDVTAGSLEEYLKVVGKNSIEILNAPSANGNRGHMAIRIGKVVYSVNTVDVGNRTFAVIERIDPKTLFRKETDQLYGQGHRYYGYLLAVTPYELDALTKHYEAQVGKLTPYSVTGGNCALNVCQGTNSVGVTAIPQPFSLEPSLARIFAETSGRLKLRTRYNDDTGPSHRDVILGQIYHRFFYYRRVLLGQ